MRSNGIRVQGLSGDVSLVSVQSSIEPRMFLTGKKWGGLAFKSHEFQLQRDELKVFKCQGGKCVLEITSLGNEHGATILQKDVSREALRPGDSRRVKLEQGQSLTITTAHIVHPLHKRGAIIET
jgi:hypothetical protein